MMVCPVGDARGDLNWSVDEKQSEEYRFQSHGTEVVERSHEIGSVSQTKEGTRARAAQSAPSLHLGGSGVSKGMTAEAGGKQRSSVSRGRGPRFPGVGCHPCHLEGGKSELWEGQKQSPGRFWGRTEKGLLWREVCLHLEIILLRGLDVKCLLQSGVFF